MKKIIAYSLAVLLFGFMANPDSISSLAGNTNAPQLKNGPVNKEEILARAASLAVPFVRNAGQFAAEVKYTADLFSGRFFLTGSELVYFLSRPVERKVTRPDQRGLEEKIEKSASAKGLVFREFFLDKKGVAIGFAPEGEGKTETMVSYFKGSDAAKWRSGVASYHGVSLGRVFPGIEVKLKASGRNVEKVFYVSPRGDVGAIRIGVAGIDGLKIADDGRLLFKNSFKLAMRAPVAWQEIKGKRRDVKVGYRLLGNNQYGFSITGGYDKNHTLVIDPDLDTLLASTYLGGSTTDRVEFSHSLAVDRSGNVYVAGYTYSSDFPTTQGAYDRTFSAYWSTNYDSFLSKFDGNLTELLASTYLGGSFSDKITSLALDNVGNVYVYGSTNSTDFPTTPGAYGRSKPGMGNVFISKLDSGLTNLLASTYFGGSFLDDSSSLALDKAGSVYVTGLTDSKDFPTTSGAYDRTYDNQWVNCGEIYISKLDGSLSTLLASTFLSQAGRDGKPSLCLDKAGNVFLTGLTFSEEFPTTPGAYDRSKDGYAVAFVSKMNGDLTELLASTFLGGDGWNCSRSLALDGLGNVYLTGNTNAANFPTTTGAFDRTFSNREAFVSVLNNSLTTLQASTFLGGEGYEFGNSLVLDRCNNVYVTGDTGSPDFPTTPGAYSQKINGADVFISMLNSGLTELLASTYLGGSDNGFSEVSYSLGLDYLGNVFVTGTTDSVDFPVSPGAYQTHRGGYFDVFVSKLNTSTFNCLPGLLDLDLQAERREIKAFSIVRQYGSIRFSGASSDLPVSQYRLMRRKGNEGFVLVKTIAPSELQNNQIQTQDKYLEKDFLYTYRLEACDVAGMLIGISSEETI